MFSKRFFLSLLTIGLMAAPLVACSDDNDDDECNVKGYVCGSNNKCDALLKCATFSGGDPACEGKTFGDACDASDASKKCDDRGRCVGGSVADACASKSAGDSCGDNKVCNGSKKCVAAITGGDAECKGKYEGFLCQGGACDAGGNCVAVSKVSARSIRYDGNDKGHKAAVIDSSALDSFVAGQYDLNFELMRGSSSLDGQNAMISTFSIQTALGMVWAGAAGDTKSQMATALHFDDHTHDALNKINAVILGKNKAAEEKGSKNSGDYSYTPEQVIKTSNDLYYAVDSYAWKDSWLKVLDNSYDAGITEMDFAADPEAARKYINKVVSDNTNQRIEDLIPEGSIKQNTAAVVTNSIYLKAPWASRLHFGSGDMDFHVDASTVKKVDAISAKDSLSYVKGSDYAAVSVPLRDSDFQVLFVLPDDGKYDDVWSGLNGRKISELFVSMSVSTVELVLPKIEFTTSLVLNDALKAGGMVDAFDGAKADFSDMYDVSATNSILKIDLVLHKSFIAMNEDGVEAAAATAVIMSGNSGEPEEVVEFTLDRPYIFVIYESSSKSPLFVGRVLDPTQK